MMIFTPGQLIALIIFTEFMIYATLSVIMNTIKHCATSRAYKEAIKNGIMPITFKEELEVK